MTDDLLFLTPPITRDAVQSAAHLCCCRFGNAAGEATRRGRVTALARLSAELAVALQEFASVAAQRRKDIHVSADMTLEAGRVADAFDAWSFAVSSAAALRGACVDHVASAGGGATLHQEHPGS